MSRCAPVLQSRCAKVVIARGFTQGEENSRLWVWDNIPRWRLIIAAGLCQIVAALWCVTRG